MSGSQRLLLVAIAVVIAVGAVVIIGSGDSEEEPSTQAQKTTTQQETAKPVPPKADQIAVKGGRPVGGVKKVEAERGERVRVVVTADAPDEVHLHGYDMTRRVGPGRPARFSFEADAEGIFEMELHAGHTAVAEVVVGPS